MTGHQIAAQPYADFTEVELGLPARKVGLGNKYLRITAAVLCSDFGTWFSDVGSHDRIGDVGHLSSSHKRSKIRVTV
jgi:hypothetical protein